MAKAREQVAPGIGTVQTLMDTMDTTENRNEKKLRLPDFVHIGPPRTGTTWMHEVLKGHVGLPEGKSTRFFETEYHRGLTWYADHFSNFPSNLPCGEMQAHTFSNTIARNRMRKDIPNCRIVCSLRDPATRLYSAYRLLYRGYGNALPYTFDQYWKSVLVACGYDLCSYATNLRRWQETFGKDRVLVLFYQDLESDPQSYLDTVCDFVGAPRVALENSTIGGDKVFSAWAGARNNSAARYALRALKWFDEHGGRPLLRIGRQKLIGKLAHGLLVEDYEPLSQSSAEEIREMMLPETDELERMTGRNLSSWKPGALRNGRRTREKTHAFSS